MNLFSVAIGVVFSSWAPGITAAASGVRRKLDEETVTAAHASDPNHCDEAKREAAQLTASALNGCATVGAGDIDPRVEPNPTCLLLLCRAQQTGNYLIASSCENETVDANAAITDVCPLVPGLLIPEAPIASDDMVVLDFDADARPSVTVDVLANDKFTFGQQLQVTSIMSQVGPGTCDVVDNQVRYTPSFPNFDSGTTDCKYKTCYVGRYDTHTYILPGLDLCDVATLSVEVIGAPTGSPTLSPSTSPTGSPTGSPTMQPTDPCDLSLAVTPALPFPPDGFDPNVRCTQRPYEMTMKFNGGNCTQSDNLQGPDHSDKFSCRDRNGGPSAEGQHYIVSSYTDFEGVVNVGQTFSLRYDDAGSWFPSDMQIRVYAGNSTDTLVQNIWFHASCSKPLRLSDKFGSVQVFGFKNSQANQGTVSLVQPFATLIEITNNSPYANVTVKSLYFDVNGDGGIIPGISNKTLGFGMGLNHSTSTPVDTTGPLVYQANVEAVGANNLTCSAVVNATDFYAVPDNTTNTTNTTSIRV